MNAEPDDSKSKPNEVTEKDKEFLNSYRKNYEQIKIRPTFGNYCNRYYHIMKAAKFENDIYMDYIILKQENKALAKFKGKFDEQKEEIIKLQKKNEELLAKEKDHKVIIAGIYEAIKNNIISFYDRTKTDNKKEVKSIMDAYKVTAQTLMQIKTEITPSTMRKSLSVFEQELKLIIQNEPLVRQRFEEFRALLSADMKKGFKKRDESKDPSRQSTEKSQIANSTLNSTSNTSMGMTIATDIFKVPSAPLPRKKTSTNGSLSESNPCASKTLVPVNLSKENSTETVSSNEIQESMVSEESFIKHVCTESTKLTPKTEDTKETPKIVKKEVKKDVKEVKEVKKDVKAAKELFGKDILVESTARATKEKEVAKPAPKKEANPIEKKAAPKMNETKVLTEESFVKHVVYESTKIDKRGPPKAGNEPVKTTPLAQKPQKPCDDLVGSEESFRKYVVHQSTKIVSQSDSSAEELKKEVKEKIDNKSDSATTKKPVKPLVENVGTDDGELEETIGSEESFRKHLVYQSTRVTSKENNQPVKTSEKAEEKGAKVVKTVEKKATTPDYRGRMSLGKSTWRPSKNVAGMSLIEEASESNSSGSASRSACTDSGSSRSHSGSSKNSTGKSDENKENIDCSSASEASCKQGSSTDSVRRGDGGNEQTKTSSKQACLRDGAVALFREFDAATEYRQLNTYSSVCNDPWNEKLRSDIWKRSLPQIICVKNVLQVDRNFAPKIFFGTKSSNKEFTTKRVLKRDASVEVLISNCEGQKKDFIVKVFHSKMCFDFYIIKCIFKSLKHSADTTATKVNTKIENSICPVLALTLTSTSSYLLMPYCHKGSLVDLCTYLHGGDFTAPEIETLTAYVAMEIITIVHRLHLHARILHCNLQPGKILLNGSFPLIGDEADFEFRETRVILLISFSRGIDLNDVPANTGFLTSDDSMMTRCIETKLKRLWSYQIDLFNVAVSLYLLLRNTHPRVIHLNNRMAFGDFNDSSLFSARDVWLNLFDLLINFQSNNYGNVVDFVELFREFIVSKRIEYDRIAVKVNEFFK